MRGITITLSVLLGMALVLGLVCGAEPAGAAFPGSKGKIVFASDRLTATNPSGDSEIYTVDPTDPSGSVAQLTDNTATDQFPTYSADGQKIAFYSNRDGNYEIYTMDANGNNETNISNNNSAQDFTPAFSPDGRKVVFVRVGLSADSEVYRMDTDPTTEDATRLTNNSAEERTPAWSPNGQKIAFSSDRDGNYEIYTMKPNGTDLRRLTRNSALDDAPDWSPGGTKLAFASFRAGFEIFTMRADGSSKRNLTTNTAHDQWPAFSPDGTHIAFVSNREAVDDIYVMNSDGTNQARLTNNSRSDVAPDWQPL